MNSSKGFDSYSGQIFEYRAVEKTRLIISLSITSLVMILEIIGGFLTNSIALITDAGHMFTHSFAIGISLLAILIARQPACHHKTFGLYRAEILAAFINGLFLLLVVVTLVYEAIMRIIQPVEILAGEMFLIAIIGLFVNLLSILLLTGIDKNDLNLKGLFYHILGDTVSSIGIVIGSIIIFLTGWTIVDPLVSIFISFIILIWAFGILRGSTRILLEMTPKGLTIDMIEEDIKRQYSDVREIQNTHLWTITSDRLVFTSHLLLNQPISVKDQEILISSINQLLYQKYQIIDSTLQIRYS